MATESIKGLQRASVYGANATMHQIRLPHPALYCRVDAVLPLKGRSLAEVAVALIGGSSDGHSGSALYLLSSLFNHACLPSVDVQYSDNSSRRLVCMPHCSTTPVCLWRTCSIRTNSAGDSWVCGIAAAVTLLCSTAEGRVSRNVPTVVFYMQGHDAGSKGHRPRRGVVYQLHRCKHAI